MNWLLSDLIRRLSLTSCLGYMFISAYSQNCNCPKTCNPCAGGISSITLKYTGASPAAVTVYDKTVLLFSKPVSKGETFSVTGQSGGKFSANQIDVLINATLNVSITVNCSLEFDPSKAYGLFTIVGATSKNGGTLCCTSNSDANDPPEITGCPSNISVLAGANCSVAVSWTAPKAIDCDLHSFTPTKSPGDLFTVGTTIVTYTATDDNENTTTCNFKVTVNDTSPPTVTGVPGTIKVNADSTCKKSVVWTAPVFTDNCGLASVTSSHASGGSFSLGTTEVTYTAKDNSGNTTVSKFSIVVTDSTGPSVKKCPSDIIVNPTANCKAKASWIPPVFNDNCSSVTVTSTHAPDDEFPVGTTVVTYTAKDNANNITLCTFNVIVKDLVAPVITGCPSDIVITTSAPSSTIPVQWTLPVATDDCFLVSLTSTHQPGDFFPAGNSTVTYTATDKSDNTAVCTFQVKIMWEDIALDILQLITPNGDGTNDVWTIGNIEKYEINNVVIVDRWGSTIYSATGYDNQKNVWNGENGKGTIVPTGTYFYTISIRSGPSTIEKKGFIEVVR